MQPVDKRKAVWIGGGLLLAAMVWHTPTASLEIKTHDVADISPKKMEAALDLGVAAFSLLVTWTASS